MEFHHVSVLLNECIENLNIKPDGVYVDCTMGGAGHSKEIVKRLSDKGLFIGFDQDKNAIAILFKWLSMMMISCSLYYVWYGLLSEMNMAMIFNINYVIMTAITFLFVKKGLKVRDYD